MSEDLRDLSNSHSGIPAGLDARREDLFLKPAFGYLGAK